MPAESYNASPPGSLPCGSRSPQVVTVPPSLSFQARSGRFAPVSGGSAAALPLATGPLLAYRNSARDTIGSRHATSLVPGRSPRWNCHRSRAGHRCIDTRGHTGKRRNRAFVSLPLGVVPFWRREHRDRHMSEPRSRPAVRGRGCAPPRTPRTPELVDLPEISWRVSRGCDWPARCSEEANTCAAVPVTTSRGCGGQHPRERGVATKKVHWA
jgi:hypothetical protein